MLVLANAIGVVHIVVEMWLATGLLLALLFPRVLRYYVATLALTWGSRLMLGDCPFTVWQESIKHGPGVEPLLSTAFIIDAPRPWMYPGAGGTQVLIAIAFVLTTALMWFRRSANA